MKPKKPKARVMWAWPSQLSDKNASPLWAMKKQLHRSLNQAPVPVAVIPLDDVELIVAKVKLALVTDWTPGNTQDDQLRVALTAAGIPCTKRRARK